MHLSTSLKSRCSILTRKSVFAAYGIAMASAASFLYSLVLGCPWVMNSLTALVRLLQASGLSVDVLLPVTASLFSLPLLFFTGRALISFGSRLMRTRQSELASSMTVTGSIVWLFSAAVGCSGNFQGHATLLTILLSLMSVMNSLVFIAGMISAAKKLHAGSSITNDLPAAQQGTDLVAAL